VHLVKQAHKSYLLSYLIKQNDWQQVLVFTRTKHGANRLAEKLSKDGILASAIHGNKSQSARTKALADFKAGNIPVLVATDIAARGLDIDQLPQVVNFELPNVPEDYVHRIGRTGRAGSSGAAISLVDFEEAKYLKDIEKLIKRDIPKVAVEGFEAPTQIAPEAPRGPRNMPPRNKPGNKPRNQSRNNANKRPSNNNASASRMDVGSQSIAPKVGQNQGQKPKSNFGQNANRNQANPNQARPQANGNKPVHHSGNRGK
jgi:ATP-dependent RNA helicase RhlE